MTYDCPECGKPLKKSKAKARFFCENSACSVIFVRHPDNQPMMEITYSAGAQGMRQATENSLQDRNHYPQVCSRIASTNVRDSHIATLEFKEACGYRGAGQTPICKLRGIICDTVPPFDKCKDYVPRSQLETREAAMKVSNSANDSGTVPEAGNLDESTIELVFSRDCLVIRSPVFVPLKGRLLHEERIGYSEIPSGGLNMQVISIEKQEENDQLKALVFKVIKFEQASKKRQASKEQETSATIRVKSRSWTEYFFVNVAGCRSIFPGYKVPFVLVTDQGDIWTKVAGAWKDTPYGAPLEGFMISGLKAWYLAHPGIRVGDSILFETIEPKKRYRLSLLDNSEQSELPIVEEKSSKTPEMSPEEKERALFALFEKPLSRARKD